MRSGGWTSAEGEAVCPGVCAAGGRCPIVGSRSVLPSDEGMGTSPPALEFGHPTCSVPARSGPRCYRGPVLEAAGGGRVRVHGVCREPVGKGRRRGQDRRASAAGARGAVWEEPRAWLDPLSYHSARRFSFYPSWSCVLHCLLRRVVIAESGIQEGSSRIPYFCLTE